MNAARWLTFLWTPWSALVSVMVIAIAAMLCFLAWRRSGYRPSMGVLEVLRFVLVVAAVVLFNQPEVVQEFRPSGKPTVVVLSDDSPSMQTRDVRSSPTPAAGKDTATAAAPAAGAYESRTAAIGPLTKPEAWSALQDRFQVVHQAFSAPDGSKRTNLNEPIASLIDEHPRLLAVVVASDGDWNAGGSPVPAATRLRMKGVPVFSVPVGQPTRLPDIELLSLDAPTFAVAGKVVRIPFVIDSSLPREHVATVTLRASAGDEVQEEIAIAPMGRTHAAISWKPQTTGDVTLTAVIPPHPEETMTDNNKLSAPIAIREERLRVLIVESYPRWEYRYLRNALSRDPGVDVACLLFHPELGKVGGGNKDYIPQFPPGLDQLSLYDVIFLGDVGLDNGQLTEEQCRWIKGVVQHQATGLVFMPGIYGRHLSLLESELGELYPVVLDATQSGGWGSRTPNHFELTETGQRSLLTKLADTEEESAAVWEGLPGFQWYAAVERAKPGAEVLCVHQEADNAFGRLPLLVTRTFGAGKILFMGTDGAWRWRKGVEDKYHYRFWGQVVRWMAYQRNMAKGETMRLYYSPDQPQLDQTVMLNANVMELGGEPLQNGTVTARIVAPSGAVDTVRMPSVGEEWGAYSGRHTLREPGRHEITLACQETGASLQTSVFVQGVADERPGRAARPDVLAEISRITQGKILDVRDVPAAVRALSELPTPPAVMRRVQLWCHPLVGGTFVTLLGVFWVGRKMLGLI